MTLFRLIVHDQTPPTHVMVEKYLPADEARQYGGYVFVSPELGRRLGPSDDVVTIHGNEYPAWKMASGDAGELFSRMNQ